MAVRGICLTLAMMAAAPSWAASSGSKPYLQMPMEMYPAAALAANLEATIDVTLVSGPGGSSKECKTTGGDKIAVLKEATCAILSRRLVFPTGATPGQTVRVAAEWRIFKGTKQLGFGGAIAISPMNWVSSDDFPSSELGRGGTVEMAFDIGVNGRATGCRIEHSSGSDVLNKTSCDIINARAHFLPAIDDSGRPRPTVGRHRLIWNG